MTLRAGRLDVALGAENFRLLATVGAHPVRAALAHDTLKARSGRSPSATESLFSCVAKRKVTKREGHPAWRLSGLGQPLLRCLNSGIHALAVPGKSVSRGRAFRTGILPVRKGIDILVDARYAACRPRLTAAQGPRVEQRAILARTRWRAERLESNSNGDIDSTNKSGGEAQHCCCAAVAPAFLKSARLERAALPGAPMARRAGGGKPAGWPAWTPASFSPAQDVLSKNPVARSRTRRAGCPEGVPSGWPLFGLLFSGHSEKSDSPSEGGRKLFALDSVHAGRSRRKSPPQVCPPC